MMSLNWIESLVSSFPNNNSKEKTMNNNLSIADFLLFTHIIFFYSIMNLKKIIFIIIKLSIKLNFLSDNLTFLISMSSNLTLSFK